MVPRFRARLLFPIHDLRGPCRGIRRPAPRSRASPSTSTRPRRRSSTRGGSSTTCTRPRRRSGRRRRSSWSRGTSTCSAWCSPASSTSSRRWAPRSPADQAALLRRFAPRGHRCSTTATRRASAPPSAPATSCCATACGCGWPRCPTGEDPDTLVRQGGAAALEPILDDAIDLLERKIQLLEQKGWFEGVEHQREALDRLLPTIRAAADPITRDLYLKTVSERTGREPGGAPRAGRAPARPLRPAPPDAPDAGRRAPARGAGRGAARGGARRSAAERELLRVLMRDRAWLARAATKCRRSGSRPELARGVRGAAAQSRKRPGPAIFLEQLSPAGATALGRGSDSIEAKYGSPDPDQDVRGRVPDAGGATAAAAAGRAQPSLAGRQRAITAEDFDDARTGASAELNGTSSRDLPRGAAQTHNATRGRRCTLIWSSCSTCRPRTRRCGGRTAAGGAASGSRAYWIRRWTRRGTAWTAPERAAADAGRRRDELEPRSRATGVLQERRRQRLEHVRNPKEASTLMAELDLARSVMAKEENDWVRERRGGRPRLQRKAARRSSNVDAVEPRGRRPERDAAGRGGGAGGS